MINFMMFNKLIERVLKKAGKKIQEIDMFIYPNFSTWDQNYFCAINWHSQKKGVHPKIRRKRACSGK